MNEEKGRRHPSYGVVEIVSVSGTPRKLFGSDILHSSTVELRVNQAKRDRKLNNDFILSEGKRLITINSSSPPVLGRPAHRLKAWTNRVSIY